MNPYERMMIEFTPMSEFPTEEGRCDKYHFLLDDGTIIPDKDMLQFLPEITHFAPLQKPVAKLKYVARASAHNSPHWVVALAGSDMLLVALDLTQAQAEAVAKVLNKLDKSQ
jgi:hypothetical protein